PNDILTRAIDEVCSGAHRTADHASAVLDEIMEGRAGEVQTAAFLVALRAKGETVAELVGLARTMRRLAAHVEAPAGALVDTAGTGGGPTTFNISTAAALVAAAAGCAVAKHGNRSSTSRCGSADLLEALGGNIELAVRTIFNFLGPLTNPAGATRQLLGVSDRHYQETIAEALIGLGCERALVVNADDGLDEITITGRTRMIEVADGRTEEIFVTPADVGLRRADLAEIAGGTPEENAAIVRRVLAGEDSAARDVVLLNAGAAILVGGAAEDLAGGVERAREALDSGAAATVLERLVALTGALGAA